MKHLGYCVLGGKDYVLYEDNKCEPGWFKLTDGFHDKKVRWDSEETVGIAIVGKKDIDLERIVSRMRGARPWHPLLAILSRKECKA